MARISLHHLTIGYPSHTLGNDINLAIQPGQLVALLGRNGCGKSTLLRTIAGLQPALAGSILLTTSSGTQALNELSTNQRAQQLSLVLTERTAMDQATVIDIVSMGRYPYASFFGNLSTNDVRIVRQSLQAVQIEELSNRFFNELSDGEKARVLIAKAIAQQTPTILLDEPTAHLDIPNRIQTFGLLRSLAHEQAKTILISTHELDLALQYSDQIILMNDDQLLFSSPESLKAYGAFMKVFGL